MDSTAAPEAVFASEIDKLRKDGVKPKERGNRKGNNGDEGTGRETIVIRCDKMR